MINFKQFRNIVTFTGGFLILALVIFTLSLNQRPKVSENKEEKVTDFSSYVENSYIEASLLTKEIVDNFKLLLDNFPDKYKFLTDKLNEYKDEMIIEEEDKQQGQVLYVKGMYNVTYADELISLVKSNIADDEIIKDFKKITEGEEKTNGNK